MTHKLARKPHTTPIFPEPPLTMDHRAWHEFGQKISAYMSEFAVDFDPPERITGFEAETRTSGFVLTWNPARKAHGYLVYRNTSSDQETAIIVSSNVGPDSVYYFDVADSVDQANTTLYYWVRGFNAADKVGPWSEMVTVTNQLVL